MDIRDKVALVTGGAQRVGRAVVAALAQAGAHVAFTYLTSRSEAAEVADMVRRQDRLAFPIQADLNDPLAAGKIRKQLLAKTHRLDILINNASVFRATPWGRVTREAWHETMRVNLTAPLMLTQEFSDLLTADPGGRVVNFVDIHVMGRPRKGFAAYNASKAALIELTYSMALELAPKVTVNAIAPGVVAWAKDMDDKQQRGYLSRVPLQRAGTPKDAASAVLFLVRDADYLTGQVVRVDGGRWLT